MLISVFGAQWGDEGKGKIVDLLSENADFVVRFHGGNNAGHTVVNKFGKFPLHLVPSGICNPKARCLITNGVILDLEVLLKEIKLLDDSEIKMKGRLLISPRCHLIMPYHKILDKLYEEAKGKIKTGTTGRGIGPTYADKVSYNGIRVFDLLNPNLFALKLKTQLLIKNRIIKSLGGEILHFQKIFDEFSHYRIGIKPYINETLTILQKAVTQEKKVLFEGAHGFFLDNDWGTYPFCTASAIVPGSINSTCGLPIIPERIIAIAKAYTTRVGEGPFPTELNNSLGNLIRERGNEFGTTTGRPRRCGWFDAEMVRFACKICGASEVALTKLDILDDFKEIKICTGYNFKGKRANYADGDANFFAKVKPIYKILPGWKTSTDTIRNWGSLPTRAKMYIQELEKQIGTKISYISVGPEREAIIKK
ncbi:adenylosuccinate synthase [Candidatus Shapirobacteria bacterium]|nr:adenylosuccinate synthase [Candidatus Shapirobacteria bacterium]